LDRKSVFSTAEGEHPQKNNDTSRQQNSYQLCPQAQRIRPVRNMSHWSTKRIDCLPTKKTKESAKKNMIDKRDNTKKKET